MIRHALVLLCALLLLSSAPQAAAGLAGAATMNPLLSEPFVLRLLAYERGVMTVDRSALVAAGWPADLDTARVHVWRDGSELAVVRQPDRIRFVVAPSERRTTLAASYWLTLQPTAGLSATALLSTTPPRWEPDTIYWPTRASQRGDRWFAGLLRGSEPLTVTLGLSAALPTGAVFELGLVTPQSGAAAQLVVEQAGVVIAAATSQPQTTVPFTIAASLQEPLPAGLHTLQLRLVEPADPLLVDWLSLPQGVWALPDLPAPQLLPVVMPEARGADLLILADPALWDAALPLVAAHQRRGTNAVLVDPQAAYDTYSFGERDPEAIRQFIAATRTWQPAPRSLLLFGAGTSALRRTVAADDAISIPPYLIDGDQKYGELACDSCYGRVSAADPLTQPVADLQVGRLPARNVVEARLLATKSAQALAGRPAGSWQSQALLLADNDAEPDGSADPAGPFGPLLDAAAHGIAGLAAVPLRYAPAAGAGDQPAAALRRELFARWNAGAALLVYAGHGSPWQWGYSAASEPVPQLVADTDTALLTNGARLPVVLSLTCRSGAWQNPWRPTLEETLLRHSGGGALAVLSAGGAATTESYAVLATAVLDALLDDASIGEAQRVAQKALAQRAATRELSFAINLLGDPEIRLPFVPKSVQYVPVLRT